MTRPGRRMPSILEVADFHDRPAHRCWRCGERAALQKAHLVDRCFGGLDGPQNLALLCELCHRLMSPYEPAQHADAVAYAMPADPGPHQLEAHIVAICSGESWWSEDEALARQVTHEIAHANRLILDAA